MRFSTLLASNPDKARKALDARRTVLPEEGSKDAETKNIKGAFGGWLPWTRRDMTDGIETSDAFVETKRTIPAWSPWDRGGKREIVDNIEVAPASAEEVCVSDKGCVVSALIFSIHTRRVWRRRVTFSYSSRFVSDHITVGVMEASRHRSHRKLKFVSLLMCAPKSIPHVHETRRHLRNSHFRQGSLSARYS